MKTVGNEMKWKVRDAMGRFMESEFFNAKNIASFLGKASRDAVVQEVAYPVDGSLINLRSRLFETMQGRRA